MTVNLSKKQYVRIKTSKDAHISVEQGVVQNWKLNKLVWKLKKKN